jgi:hypothetical protein
MLSGAMKLLAATILASSVLVSGTPADSPRVLASCPDYANYSTVQHSPLSSGRYKLSSMRPQASCRTFVSSAVDNTVKSMQSKIKDPDLYRLFQNACKPSL